MPNHLYNLFAYTSNRRTYPIRHVTMDFVTIPKQKKTLNASFSYVSSHCGKLSHQSLLWQKLLCCGQTDAERTMILLTPSSGFFQHTNKLFLSEQATGVQLKEFVRKNAANALSMANMLMGMASILCSLNGHQHAACWLVLIGYLLDLADGAVARRLDACSALDFTTFGIATSLLLRTHALMDNILCMCYVLSVIVRLCFFSSGIPFMYRGLPCIYSSAILACLSLLTGGNMVILRVTAVAMILFMVNQGFYPHDRVLESQAWKKVVYAGGVVMVFCSSFPPACVYYLLWSVSYILFPTTLWSCKV
ncbi:transmembrane protein 269 isoform X2 [Oncorhynchus kisutch]|uniref:transmembrane protein 269 isoform X2 n=1 Tax=Oncorhynchus kisutch TaxID=8019 RepID=UPI0012DD8335|nr:transmembrane protein 269-like isoform X2 [Oncorhynchus kisutch]